MSDLQGQGGELRFSMEIKRKDTGVVEKFDLIGKITSDESEALGLNTTKEEDHGSNPQHRSA